MFPFVSSFNYQFDQFPFNGSSVSSKTETKVQYIYMILEGEITIKIEYYMAKHSSHQQEKKRLHVMKIDKKPKVNQVDQGVPLPNKIFLI